MNESTINESTMNESTKNSSLSFSFSLDLDSVDSDASSDSDTTGLQIDVSEMDNFSNTKATILRRQVTVDDPTFLNEMEEEIERQLDAKAAKTNLTATNVKNILKHVISHEHVRAMVSKTLTKGDENVIFEPKLTRAKAKELALTQPDIPWPVTPVKTTTSEVQVLIQEEFLEDSSDEEYHPDQDPQSDDDKDIENSVGSDLDSLPRTPATSCDLSTSLERAITPEIQYDTEGIFKVPSNFPLVPTEEESIGHRTRSKLCLSETPLELIEQAFIPPDITTDMYDWDWEPEDEYINFLKELYTQPLPKEINIDDDPEADPEYNILEDEEVELLDKEEELREDRAVKITKKELKTLIAELDEFADQYAKQHEQDQLQQQLEQDQQHQKIAKKKRTPDSSFVSADISSSSNPMVGLLPVLAEPELPELVNPEQRYLLSVQLSQHVQQTVQQFLMTYKHPLLHKHSQICKSNLNSLSALSGQNNSKFISQNLDEAFKLVSDWESKLADETFFEEYIEYLKAEIEQEKNYFHTRRKYKSNFHPELIELMVNSKALMHPQLLPAMFPNSTSLYCKSKTQYLSSEEYLIAIGLEQFLPYVKSLKKQFNKDYHIFNDAVKEIQKYLLPIRDVAGLIYQIKKRKAANSINPIKHYYSTGSAPRTEHIVLNKYELKAPINQPAHVLPLLWKGAITNLQRGMLQEFLCFKHRKPMKKQTKNIDFGDEFLPISRDEIIPHKDHELRNPIVNVLRNMPLLMTPQKADTSTSTSKSSNASSSSKSKTTQSRVNEPESDVESSESIRTCETDEEELRTTRLRMTTPRLAKIKSAQNMKLMAQSLSPKVSTSSSSVSENKEYTFEKNDDDASSCSKGDNEDEIAELMLASTTIKKNTASRKKTKQARELENLKRLLEAENNINECDRATKFAASFIQKISMKVESKDPELYRTVFKLLSDYSEKTDNLDQNNGSDYFLNESASFTGDKNLHTIERKDIDRDKLAVELYKEINDKLQEYPDLLSDFLLFLTPHQAAQLDKSVEHTHLLKMREFVQVTEMYFAKQPSRIGKIMQAMTQISSDPFITIESAQAVMGAALKGHPLIMDLFLQILPTGKPPESLFAAHMFENLSCPVGPHDKNKAYDVDAPEFYENIELPVSTPQEDPYGGDSCKCDCHNLIDDLKPKGTTEHCASCGTRFLNGRIYLQTSEGLRPAKITFPGADDEKLENISRVSLKTTERFIPCPPTRKRRKSSKRDSISEESNVKSCSSKSSPTKDSLEESDKPMAKSKKVTKSPPKSTDTKKLVKSTSVKNKREKRTDKKDSKSEQKTDDDQNDFGLNTDHTESEEGIGNNINDEYVDLFGSKLGEISTDSHEDDTMASPEKVNNSSTSVEKLDNSSDSDSSTHLDNEIASAETPWTMQEDKILLENVQIEYSEKTFNLISSSLKNRSVDQVKERCEYLLSLIEKMA